MFELLPVGSLPLGLSGYSRLYWRRVSIFKLNVAKTLSRCLNHYLDPNCTGKFCGLFRATAQVDS